jgi:hypothetical protein
VKNKPKINEDPKDALLNEVQRRGAAAKKRTHSVARDEGAMHSTAKHD